MGFVSFGKKGDDKTLAGLIDRSITSVTIPNGAKSIGTYAFNDCSNLSSVIIQEGVTSIGGCAFQNCKKLSSVTIPKGVTSIAAFAFSGCNVLANITIPNTVTAIGIYAFNGCSNLSSVIIPNGIRNIQVCAFQNCSKLTELILLRDIAANLIDVNALANTPIADGTGYIYVPKVLLEDYKTATNWVTFADQFRAIEDYPEVLEVSEND